MKNLLSSLMLICGFLNALPISAVDNEGLQESAIEQLLLVENSYACDSLDVSSLDVCSDEHGNEDGLFFQLSTAVEQNSCSSCSSSENVSEKSKKVETYAVFITVVEGYTFHVADYYGPLGHSRVVSCLDGDMKGEQIIVDNDVLTGSSSNVKWHKKYFSHKYANGKIYSYPNKQIISFN